MSKLSDLLESAKNSYAIYVLLAAVVSGTIAVIQFAARASDIPPIKADVAVLKEDSAARAVDVEWLKKSIDWSNRSLFRLVQQHGLDDEIEPPPERPKTRSKHADY